MLPFLIYFLVRKLIFQKYEMFWFIRWFLVLHCKDHSLFCTACILLTNRSNLRALKMRSVACRGSCWIICCAALAMPLGVTAGQLLLSGCQVCARTVRCDPSSLCQAIGSCGGPAGVVWCELCAHGVCVPTSASWAGATWLIFCWFLVSCSFFISIVQIPLGTQ